MGSCYPPIDRFDTYLKEKGDSGVMKARGFRKVQGNKEGYTERLCQWAGLLVVRNSEVDVYYWAVFILPAELY